MDMKTSTRFAAMGSVAALAIAAAGIGMGMGGHEAATASAPAPAEAKTYTVDPVHTSVVFKIKHMGTSNFYGRFDETSGSFTLGETCSVEMTVKTDSVDTNNKKRDSDVKGPDMLGVKEFPEMKFVGKDFKKSGEGAWKGTGQLTFHGQTKPLEVEIKQTGGGKGMGGKQIAGIEASFTFKRSEFGSTAMVGPLSDEVTIWVASEGGMK
jgi:polyisoprenoid-binding protein YceI